MGEDHLGGVGRRRGQVRRAFANPIWLRWPLSHTPVVSHLPLIGGTEVLDTSENNIYREP